jgi:release factor glutamine methyltransferase
MPIDELTIGAIIAKTVPFLADQKIPNPRLEADLMLAKVLDQPRVKLYSEWDRVLKPAEVQHYREMIVKRVQGWPLAYLTGKKSFLSWDFTVTPFVLIPRPETEVLIETVVELVKNRTELYGVDVGTGSGIIAIALAKLLPGSTWFASDISEEALQVAKENASNLGVASQIEFVAGDLLESLLPARLGASHRKFDIIVSNPPYIPSTELPALQKEVLREPALALDGGADGLAIYRRLLPQASKLLTDQGVIAVEHGDGQRQALEKIFTESGYLSCRSFKDPAGLERVLAAGRAG